MRVIAGELRGRRLVAPKGATTRPTSDRVREATFNALGSMAAIEGARVLDAFAGSGALGIEALSRGADHCAFVERDRAALEALRDQPRGVPARPRPGDGPNRLPRVERRRLGPRPARPALRLRRLERPAHGAARDGRGVRIPHRCRGP